MDFLVVVDSFYTYKIVRKLLNSTLQAILQELSIIFGECAKHLLLKSDNGPCYLAKLFAFFM